MSKEALERVEAIVSKFDHMHPSSTIMLYRDAVSLEDLRSLLDLARKGIK